jgi:tetratricopeptide (TPR) repeat protein
MNKKILIGGVIVIVIVIVILGVGGYFYFKNTPQKPAINVDSVTVNDLPQRSQEILDKVKAELKQDLNNVDNLMTLAQFQKMSKDYSGAITTLKYAISLDNTRLVAKNNLTEVYYLNNQFPEAESMIMEMIADNIVWINSYNFLRDIYKYHMPEKYADDTLPNLIKEAIKQAVMPSDKLNLNIALFEYYSDVKNYPEATLAGEAILQLDPKNEEVKTAMSEFPKK